MYMTSVTKGDIYHKEVLQKILDEGYMDENPRPHYEDEVLVDGDTVTDLDGNAIELTEKQSLVKKEGKWYLCTPAHTLSVNHVVQQYDLSKGEFPIETLRPIAWKSAVKEILWIYQMQSNKISDLHDLGIKYWDLWDIGDGTIGCRYGATVKRHDLMNALLDGLKKDPFGRRHIINLWQEADFKDKTGGTTKGLNPCCYETIWNVRRGKDGELYIDMLMNQRSSDYETSCAINEIQYIALMLMVAKECGFKPGVFTHVIDNVQIYDRHIEQAKEIINRESIPCSAHLVLKDSVKEDGSKKGFYDFTIDDFEMIGYPLQDVKEKNPQLTFQLGI